MQLCISIAEGRKNRVLYISFMHLNSNGWASKILHKVLLGRIDVKNARGQGYDSEGNMAGKFSGVQGNVLQENGCAQFVPYALHNLNLRCKQLL
jgi:hypothetical protein